ncbi:MAG TPA: hypothetical protein VJT49_14960 [Amycolatopsis sp.]|uniref:hypothetical protein n=1 Tax=Amycolatopsis sp. TaxID=37632 RepID=UPI002B496E67|nr:hypothetical protein [Amycolatopsis sp.]HKS46379.1 hypothetical protein [Amycolatopsis sp.]
MTADLCEVITGIGMALRTQSLPTAPTLLARSGIRWTSLAADRLTDGTWTVAPPHAQPDIDHGVAAQLRTDLDTISALTQPDT